MESNLRMLDKQNDLMTWPLYLLWTPVSKIFNVRSTRVPHLFWMSCGEQYVDCWWNNGQEDARKDYRGKRRKSDLGHRRVIFLGPDLPLCKCSTNPSLLGLMHAATTWAPSNLNMRAATDESLTRLNKCYKKCESGRGWNLKLAFASEFEHCSIELSLPSLWMHFVLYSSCSDILHCRTFVCET